MVSSRRNPPAPRIKANRRHLHTGGSFTSIIARSAPDLSSLLAIAFLDLFELGIEHIVVLAALLAAARASR